MKTIGLRHHRVPGSLAEARAMVAYNEWILQTSASPQRIDRAARMLVNTRPWLAKFEAEARAAAARAAVPQNEYGDYVSVWNGKDSLDTLRQKP